MQVNGVQCCFAQKYIVKISTFEACSAEERKLQVWNDMRVSDGDIILIFG